MRLQPKGCEKFGLYLFENNRLCHAQEMLLRSDVSKTDFFQISLQLGTVAAAGVTAGNA